MRPSAWPGICDRSGPCEPCASWPPATWTKAERCMRLPLISTRIWSGGRPRSVGGRTKAEASPSRLRCWLNEGTSVCRMVCNCGLDWVARSSLVKTSIGTEDSITVRSVRRVPVTTISALSGASSSCAAASVSGCSPASARFAAQPVCGAASNAVASTAREIPPFILIESPLFAFGPSDHHLPNARALWSGCVGSFLR